MELVIEAHAKLAEGPRWWNDTLYWVDIEGCTVYVWDRPIRVDAMVGALAPVEERTLLVALADRLALLDLESGRTETLARFPHGPDVRANDGACDRDGVFWIGTMALDQREGAAALYRFDGELTRVLDGVTISNGVGWLRDGMMLYVDSPTKRVDVLHGPGRTPWAHVGGDGVPDGIAVDDEDGVWVAVHGDGVVRRYVDGEVDRELHVPADDVTACAFGGDTLYVTAGGNVYAERVGVTGSPANVFHARSTAPSDADDTSAR